MVRPLAAHAEHTSISVSADELNNSDMDSGDEFGDVIPLKVDSVFWNASASKTCIISSTTMRIQAAMNGLWYRYEWQPHRVDPDPEIVSPIATGDDDEIHQTLQWLASNAALGKCVMWAIKP